MIVHHFNEYDRKWMGCDTSDMKHGCLHINILYIVYEYIIFIKIGNNMQNDMRPSSKCMGSCPNSFNHKNDEHGNAKTSYNQRNLSSNSKRKSSTK